MAYPVQPQGVYGQPPPNYPQQAYVEPSIWQRIFGQTNYGQGAYGQSQKVQDPYTGKWGYMTPQGFKPAGLLGLGTRFGFGGKRNKTKTKAKSKARKSKTIRRKKSRKTRTSH
jgi:hypothetical protein